MPYLERGYVLFDETSQTYIRLHETLGYGLLTWTQDASLAVMFVRETDAEAFNKLHNLKMCVINHEHVKY